MDIYLYEDKTIHSNLKDVVTGLNSIVREVTFHLGSTPFIPPVIPMRDPEIYDLLSSDIWDEINPNGLGLCFTREPYENNYFFESFHDLAVVSFYAWEQLTTLPINNGIVFFTAAILCRRLSLGEPHDNTTGCINDYWWDKTGVDVGMRSAYICPECQKYFTDSHTIDIHKKIYNSALLILDDLSTASRNNKDIAEYWLEKNGEEEFDVFLCHNSEDKAAVKNISKELKNMGLLPWLDEEQLRPGIPWQEVLEEQIGKIKTVAIFVGPNGFGPWQNSEMRAFLQEFVRRNIPVIPVILPQATKVPELPIFLRQFTWVDFRKKYEDALKKLKWGITGKK